MGFPSWTWPSLVSTTHCRSPRHHSRSADRVRSPSGVFCATSRPSDPLRLRHRYPRIRRRVVCADRGGVLGRSMQHVRVLGLEASSAILYILGFRSSGSSISSSCSTTSWASLGISVESPRQRWWRRHRKRDITAGGLTLGLDRRSAAAGSVPEILKHLNLYLFEIFTGVHILHVTCRYIQPVRRAKVLVVLVHRNFCAPGQGQQIHTLTGLDGQLTGSQLYSGGQTRLKRPSPRDVPDRVSAAAQKKKGQSKGLDVLYTIGVAWNQIEREDDRDQTTMSWPRRGQWNIPLIERLKGPNRSPDSESDPHCRTTAEGRYHSMIFPIT